MLRFYDSWSHYTTAFLGAKWDVVSVPTQTGVSIVSGITAGRFGAGGVTFAGPADATTSSVSTDQAQYLQKNFSGQSTIIVALAIKQNGTQAVRGGRLLTFLDSATTQVGIDIMPSGQLRATRSTLAGTGVFLAQSIGAAPPTFTVLGTSTDSLSSTSYDFIEVKVIHHPTTGSIEVKKNGAAFWTLANVNTAISGSNNSSSVLLGGYAVEGTGAASSSVENHHLNATVSDFCLIDTVAGSDARDPVDFMGDVRGELLTPTADGTYAEWTPNSGSDHFNRVSEIPPDGDTTTNSTGTVNNRDTFIVSDSIAPTGGAVKAVVLTMYLKKDDGGTNGVSGMMRLAGADGLGTEFQAPGTYAFRQSMIFSTPAGAAITVANINSSELGYKRTA